MSKRKLNVAVNQPNKKMKLNPITAIMDLHPHLYDWTIEVRVLHIDVIEYKCKKSGEDKEFLKVLVEDSSGSIPIIFWEKGLYVLYYM